MNTPEKPQRLNKQHVKKNPVYVVEDTIYKKYLENSNFNKESDSPELITEAICPSKYLTEKHYFENLALNNASIIEEKSTNDIDKTSEKFVTYSIINKYNNSISKPIQDLINVIPPQKPPRTFAHDEYMELKNLNLSETRFNKDSILNTTEDFNNSIIINKKLNDTLLTNREASNKSVNFNDDINISDSEYAEIDFSHLNESTNLDNETNCKADELNNLSKLELCKKIIPPRPPQPINLRRSQTSVSSSENDLFKRGVNQKRASERSLNFNLKKNIFGSNKLDIIQDKLSSNVRDSLKSKKSSVSRLMKNKQAREKIENLFFNLKLENDKVDFKKVQTNSSSDSENIIKAEIMKHINEIREHCYIKVQNYKKHIASPVSSIYTNIIISNYQFNKEDEFFYKIIFEFPEEITLNICDIKNENLYFPFHKKKISENENDFFYYRFNLLNDECIYLYCLIHQICNEPYTFETYSLFSHFYDVPFYIRLLNELKNSRNLNPELTDNYIRAAAFTSFPKLIDEFSIKESNSCLKFKTSDLMLKYRISLPDSNITNFKTSDLLFMLSILLLESKIIIVSNNRKTCANFCFVLEQLLYPFHWQHLFLPYFTKKYLPLITKNQLAYIISLETILFNNLIESDQLDISKSYIINLEDNIITSKNNVFDKNICLPPIFVSTFESIFAEDYDSIEFKMALICESILNLFVITCGSFTTYLCTQQDGQQVFQRESFIKSLDSKEVFDFLDWFTLTQMFQIFIHEETNFLKHDIFHERIASLEIKNNENGLNYGFKNNVLQIGRKFKEAITDSSKKK